MHRIEVKKQDSPDQVAQFIGASRTPKVRVPSLVRAYSKPAGLVPGTDTGGN